MKILKVKIMVETSRFAGRELAKGVLKYSQFCGEWSVECDMADIKVSTRPVIRKKSFDVDGIIVGIRDKRKIDEVISSGLPAVYCVDDYIPGYPNIRNDDEAVGEMAAEYMLNLGLQRFGFIGFNDISWSQKRNQAFEAKLLEAGYNLHIYNGKYCKNYSLQRELRSIAKWLVSLPKPIGIFACHDARGLQILKICKTENIEVPDEIAVLGVNNDDILCGLATPMSSISRDFQQSGYEAAKVLDTFMRTGRYSAEDIIIRPSHIISRQSTDILAIEDKDVVEAVRLIRQNARKSITVAEVTEQLCISRRNLDRLFVKALGRPVFDEIRQSRIRLISRLLLETNDSISKIAYEMGFSRVEHFSRYYKDITKITPTDYRRKHGK